MPMVKVLTIKLSLKFRFIKNNIYGVDIDKSAIDIAKLTWLH